MTAASDDRRNKFIELLGRAWLSSLGIPRRCEGEVSASQPLLSEPDLDALDAFLVSDRAPETCMMLSDLDGFLTGIAIGPKLVKPSEWLPVIWGEGEPNFKNEEEANTIIGAIIARYNQILHQIETNKFEPIFWQGPKGIVIAADWAEGFVNAIGMCLKAWSPLLESQDDVAMMMPILALCSVEDGSSLLGIAPEDEDRVMENATEIVPQCVMAIAVYWRQKIGN